MNYRKSEAKEAAKARFRGVWAAITTRFTPDDRLDEAGLRRNMQRYTNGLRVDGVFCTGSMGEFCALTQVRVRSRTTKRRASFAATGSCSRIRPRPSSSS